MRLMHRLLQVPPFTQSEALSEKLVKKKACSRCHIHKIKQTSIYPVNIAVVQKDSHLLRCSNCNRRVNHHCQSQSCKYRQENSASSGCKVQNKLKASFSCKVYSWLYPALNQLMTRYFRVCPSVETPRLR